MRAVHAFLRYEGNPHIAGRASAGIRREKTDAVVRARIGIPVLNDRRDVDDHVIQNHVLGHQCGNCFSAGIASGLAGNESFFVPRLIGFQAANVESAGALHAVDEHFQRGFLNIAGLQIRGKHCEIETQISIGVGTLHDDQRRRAVVPRATARGIRIVSYWSLRVRDARNENEKRKEHTEENIL